MIRFYFKGIHLIPSILALILFCISCKREISLSKKIPLTNSYTTDDFPFDYVDVLHPAITKIKINPEYYQFNLNRMRNIPELDSFHLVSIIVDRELYDLDLYVNNFLSKKESIKRITEKGLDTITDSNNLKHSFNAISGFKDGKRVIIPDLNNNYDFGDEKHFQFPEQGNYSFENPESLLHLPPVEFKYQGLINNKITWVNRKIKFYPNPDHMYTYLINGFISNTQNKYTTMVLFEDKWTNKMTLNSTTFEVILYGISLNRDPKIYIKPDTINHYDFSNNNFTYSLYDTIRVKNKGYKIDSISRDFNLSLSNIDISLNSTNGYRIGERLQNYTLKNLEGKEFYLFGKNNNKKYLLIDFWGTWCAPCKKLTPELKKLYAENSSKLDIISIAADELREDVQYYVSANNLNWRHAFIKLKDYSVAIRKDLKVNTFPTFILLDTNNKILMRGNSASFNRIKTFIDSN